MVSAVLLGACGSFTSLDQIDGRLRAEGFGDVDVTVDERNFSAVVVTADAPRGSTPREGELQAAEVVWDAFPRRFALLRTEIDGRDRRWTYSQLSERFGDRPDRLDRRDLEDDGNRFLVVSALALLVVAVLVLATLAAVAILITRANRRRSAASPPSQPWMPPGHAPVPPPDGWAPAAGVSLEKDAEPPADDGSPVPPTPPPSWTGGPASAPAPPPLRKEPRPDRAEARRIGRRPPGPTPDAAHTPPGWG